MPLRRKFWWTPLLSHNQSSQPRFVLFNLIFIYNLHSKISCIWCIICRVQIQWIGAASQIRQNRVQLSAGLYLETYLSRVSNLSLVSNSLNSATGQLILSTLDLTLGHHSPPHQLLNMQYIYRFKFLSNSCTSVYDSLPWYS